MGTAKKDRNIYCTNGEVVSFEVFFKEHFSKFYAFTSRFIEDSSACEDIVQEAFISVWESKEHAYDSSLMLHAYIYKIIRNKCLNYLKHFRIQRLYSQKYLREIGTEGYMHSSVLKEESYHYLYRAIQGLTPQCQEVIKLHLEGKSNQEIAQQMGITIVTVKSHKMLAYKELRKTLGHIYTFYLFFRLKKS